jgi:hypothetical protein
MNVNVILNRMSDADFDSELATLHDRYGESRAEAGNRFEQELARLAARSGWTQEELAGKLGKSARWIGYRLAFGRFLEFSTNVLKTEIPLFSLSEGRFRDLFAKTDQTQTEAGRFQDVLDQLAASIGVRSPSRDLKSIRTDIIAKFADGKWHPLDRIIRALPDYEPQQIADALADTTKHPRVQGCDWERKGVGRSWSYRIFKQERMVSHRKLTEEFTPIFKELLAETEKSQVAISLPTLRRLAQKAAQLLKKLGE